MTSFKKIQFATRFIQMLLCAALASGLFSCAESSEATKEKIIIGMYCGECHQNCSVMVELSETTANADTTKAFFNWLFDKESNPYQYFVNNSGIKISVATQEYMRNLFDLLPSTINDYDEIIGCPDCADGCGVYLATGDRHWLIDTGGHDDPELQKFVDMVVNSMDKVHEEIYKDPH